MKNDTESNAAAADKSVDAATTSVDAAATDILTPAEKKAAKAKDKAINAAEKKAAKAAKKVADELKAEKDKAKAEEKKVAAAEAKAAKDKAKAEKQQLATVERGVTPLIQAGLRAMNMVGNGNQAWTVAAFKMRELCKGTPVNFKDVALEHWGVQKNTATKLANAGELLSNLLESKAAGHEPGNWLEHLPMGSVNNLSVISGFADAKIDKGIDLKVIKIDATEADIATFARDYNDMGDKTVVAEIPSTPAADAEDAAEAAPAVSESETPAAFIGRVTADAEAIKLSAANRIKLALAVVGDLNDKQIDKLYAGLDLLFPATSEDVQQA